jgi:hypothetical protein
MNVEIGMRNAEEKMVERLIFIFTAFQLPHSRNFLLDSSTILLILSSDHFL